jgi:hypothetical protein
MEPRCAENERVRLLMRCRSATCGECQLSNISCCRADVAQCPLLNKGRHWAMSAEIVTVSSDIVTG